MRALAAALAALTCALAGAPAADALALPETPGHPRAVPALAVSRAVTGLDHAWDVQSIGTGRWLITERSGRLWLRRPGKPLTKVDFPRRRVWAAGETGLMSLAIDPEFASNGRFWTCQGWQAGGRHDIRVVRWRLEGSTATRTRTVLTGLPTSSGRHGGCRLLIDSRNGALYVGTGDAAVGTNPRDLTSLGGKVLRLDRVTGDPWPGNPWAGAKNPAKRYVYNFGHRNVQGLAQRADGTIWSAEHGPDRDDEINLVKRGADYGWNPVPGYNESVPMTDQSLPGKQTGARWRSGYPTVATSGAAWVRGSQWGALRGTLAVACLKASKVIFLKFDDRGQFVRKWVPAALRTHGRLRSITQAPNGDLLLTTDNGGGSDGVLRVSPR